MFSAMDCRYHLCLVLTVQSSQRFWVRSPRIGGEQSKYLGEESHGIEYIHGYRGGWVGGGGVGISKVLLNPFTTYGGPELQMLPCSPKRLGLSPKSLGCSPKSSGRSPNLWTFCPSSWDGHLKSLDCWHYINLVPWVIGTMDIWCHGLLTPCMFGSKDCAMGDTLISRCTLCYCVAGFCSAVW